MYQKLKRIFDFVMSLAALLILGPIMLIVGFAVKFGSLGPIFYAQERVGKNNKLFKMLKFRTMVVDAEAKSGPVWASKGDARITTVGKFLRKTRLDELPQFINVLKNEMSLVGPRAERPFFVNKFTIIIPNYDIRHSVLPGITGEAQIFNGYDTNIEDVIRKVQFDLAYLKNMSFLYDLKMLFLTIGVVFTGSGAH